MEIKVSCMYLEFVLKCGYICTDRFQLFIKAMSPGHKEKFIYFFPQHCKTELFFPQYFSMSLEQKWDIIYDDFDVKLEAQI